MKQHLLAGLGTAGVGDDGESGRDVTGGGFYSSGPWGWNLWTSGMLSKVQVTAALCLWVIPASFPKLFPEPCWSRMGRNYPQVQVPAHAWVSPGGGFNWSTRPFWQF